MNKLPLILLPLIAGCNAQRDGAAILTDADYRFEMVATMADGFISPDGLRWCGDKLMMADEGGRSIRMWQAGEDLVTLAGTDNGFTSPEDLVCDADGGIWFTDDNVGGVRRLDVDGRISVIAGPEHGLRSTEGIAIAPNGDLIVGDGETGRLFAVTPEGSVSNLLQPDAPVSKPESLAFDDEGNLYIADNEDDVLYLRRTDGSLHEALRGRDGFSPESITFARGALYITDSKHGRLWRYSPTAGLTGIASFVGEMANVQGVAVKRTGEIYLTIRAGPDDMRGYLVRLVPRPS